MKIEELMARVANKSEDHKQRAYVENGIVDIVTILIKRRLELGMSQIELSQKIKMAEHTIKRIETFEYIPSLEGVFKIAYGLNLDLKILFNPSAVDDSSESSSTLENE